jgi:hypothetical protein
LEAKNKVAFPVAVHDADPGGSLLETCYGVVNDLTGKQVMKFREVIVDYLADLATRMLTWRECRSDS